MTSITSGNIIGKLTGVNLLATGTTVLVQQQIGAEPGELVFLPQFCYVVLRTKTGGALTTSPKIRVGANGTHDDVAPLYTVPLGANVNVFALLPLVAFPFTPVDLRASSVFLEVQQAGIGPTACTGDILIVGIANS